MKFRFPRKKKKQLSKTLVLGSGFEAQINNGLFTKKATYNGEATLKDFTDLMKALEKQ